MATNRGSEIEVVPQWLIASEVSKTMGKCASRPPIVPGSVEEYEKMKRKDIQKIELFAFQLKFNAEPFFRQLCEVRFNPEEEFYTSFLRRFEDVVSKTDMKSALFLKCSLLVTLPLELYACCSFLPIEIRTNQNWNGFLYTLFALFYPQQCQEAMGESDRDLQGDALEFHNSIRAIVEKAVRAFPNSLEEAHLMVDKAKEAFALTGSKEIVQEFARIVSLAFVIERRSDVEEIREDERIRIESDILLAAPPKISRETTSNDPAAHHEDSDEQKQPVASLYPSLSFSNISSPSRHSPIDRPAMKRAADAARKREKRARRTDEELQEDREKEERKQIAFESESQDAQNERRRRDREGKKNKRILESPTSKKQRKEDNCERMREKRAAVKKANEEINSKRAMERSEQKHLKEEQSRLQTNIGDEEEDVSVEFDDPQQQAVASPSLSPPPPPAVPAPTRWMLLENTGTDCFLNAVLQLLRRTSDLSISIHEFAWTHTILAWRDREISDTASVLSELLYEIPQKHVRSSRGFRCVLKSNFATRDAGFMTEQRDAAEILSLILERIVPRGIRSRYIVRSMNQKLCRENPNCRKPFSTTYEAPIFHKILRNNEVINLEELYSNNWMEVPIEEEHREDAVYHCDCCCPNTVSDSAKCGGCDTNVPYIEKRAFEFAGDSHYVMFRFGLANNLKNRERSDWALSSNCDLDSITMMGLRWRAVAVIRHHGNGRRGHYTCQTRERDGNWWQHDDEKEPVMMGDRFTLCDNEFDKETPVFPYPNDVTDMRGVVAILFVKYDIVDEQELEELKEMQNRVDRISRFGMSGEDHLGRPVWHV